MGSGQRFHLPNALRRNKSSVKQQGYQSVVHDHKVQHLLGITETDLNTVRNQSISSSATARVPALSFSDATTELGSSHPPTEQRDLAADLHLKASSVLLHEEFLLKADIASSIRSKRLKEQNSSSTLNSFYDAQNIPLAVSQQTSESSRRDFALRKGAPVVVNSTNPDKDSHRQLKLFRLSRSGDKIGTKKLTKAGPQTPDSCVRMLFGNQRSPRSNDQAVVLKGHHLSQQHAKKGVHFNPERSVTTLNSEKSKSSVALPSRQDAPHMKVNIRRPKAGAKHWFDGLEGDSSDGESVHEPALQPSFAAGIEMAFEGGRIGPKVKEDGHITSPVPDASSRHTNSRVPSSHLLPPSAIPPRVSTLNAKSSKSTLSTKRTHPASPKTKVTSLASTDLQHTSILDLSSSDDEESASHGKGPVGGSLPQLRDSIAVDSLGESDIEIRTAKAVNTKQNASLQATPSLRRVRGTQTRRNGRSSVKPPSSLRNPRSTYLSASSAPTQEDDDLLTSFPPTPTTDQASSHRQSYQDVRLSDTASIESRTLMSVTRQEESLLAAIRSKKAGLEHFQSSTSDPRIQALMNMDRKPLKRTHQAPRSSGVFDAHLAPQARIPERVQSPYSDTSFDQASCTTFQTGASNDPSIRYSLASFRTATSVEPETDISSSFATFSPVLLPRQNATLNRTSRATFFSASTNSSRDNSRNRKENHYLATLEKLQAIPKREDVRSQSFIDWPYNGWHKLAAGALEAGHAVETFISSYMCYHSWGLGFRGS